MPVTSKLIEPDSSAALIVNQSVSLAAVAVQPEAEKLPPRTPSPGEPGSVRASFT